MLGGVKLQAHSFFEKNIKGRDFFVGDVHGRFDLLSKCLASVNFDDALDRVFSVGDLTDRGPSSLQALKMVGNSWFHPVLGNHESFILSYDPSSSYKKDVWMANGGAWWELTTETDQKLAIDLIKNNYFLTITVSTEIGDVGVVHADYPYENWVRNLTSDDDVFLKNILWGRKRFHEDDPKKIKDVSLVVSGHTPVSYPIVKGNNLFIDTGSGYGPSSRIPNPCLTIGFFSGSSFHFISISNHFRNKGEIDLSAMLSPNIRI